MILKNPPMVLADFRVPEASEFERQSILLSSCVPRLVFCVFMLDVIDLGCHFGVQLGVYLRAVCVFNAIVCFS